MLTRFDIIFGRELTEEEIDNIVCYLDENITDDWMADISPEEEPTEREHRKNVKYIRRVLRQKEREEQHRKLKTQLKSKITKFFRSGK